MYLKKYPRGIRNNNPGNIEYNPANDWEGQTGKELVGGRFATFISMSSGVRALTILLINYYERYNLKTVKDVINRWAPSIENNTDSYVKNVAQKMDVNPSETFLLNETNIINLVSAIIKHENGRDISDYDLERGVKWALSDKGIA